MSKGPLSEVPQYRTGEYLLVWLRKLVTYYNRLDAGREGPMYVNSETRWQSCGVPSAARALHRPRVSEFM